MNNTFFGYEVKSDFKSVIFFLAISVPTCFLLSFLNENSNHAIEAFSLLPLFGLGGDGAGGGGGSGTATVTGRNSTSATTQTTQANWESAVTRNGGTVTGSVSGVTSTADFGDGTRGTWSGNSNGNSNSSSTPFLTTWNGKRFIFENDFLFGKPNTAFNSCAEGLLAYKKGVGGDTYFIQNKLQSENGLLKFQIKEIEPEESFIDSFKLTAIDLPSTHHPVTDGNLSDTYIFDTTKTITLENQSAMLHRSIDKKITPFQSAYTKLGVTKNGNNTTLHTNDKIVITLPVSRENQEDIFLMVDSYFRDWTLGNEVPFTLVDRLSIQAKIFTKMLPFWCAALVMSGVGLVVKNVNADVPQNLTTPVNPGTSGSSANNWTGGSNRSLVISAVVDGYTIYLQTIFPRYVQASQEVVRIPKELLKKAVGSTLELCIHATKTHKVRSAFLFKGKPVNDVVQTPLTIVSAIKTNNQSNYTTNVTEKNGDFLHTLPSDVVELMIKDVPLKDGYVRHYMLQAHGFYTKLSAQNKNKIGNYWYDKLDGDSKKLLKNLRVYKS